MFFKEGVKKGTIIMVPVSIPSAPAVWIACNKEHRIIDLTHRNSDGTIMRKKKNDYLQTDKKQSLHTRFWRK